MVKVLALPFRSTIFRWLLPLLSSAATDVCLHADAAINACCNHPGLFFLVPCHVLYFHFPLPHSGLRAVPSLLASGLLFSSRVHAATAICRYGGVRCAFSFHFCHRKDVSIISTMNGLSKWCTTDGLSRQSSVISCGVGCCPAPALMEKCTEVERRIRQCGEKL